MQRDTLNSCQTNGRCLCLCVCVNRFFFCVRFFFLYFIEEVVLLKNDRRTASRKFTKCNTMDWKKTVEGTDKSSRADLFAFINDPSLWFHYDLCHWISGARQSRHWKCFARVFCCCFQFNSMADKKLTWSKQSDPIESMDYQLWPTNGSMDWPTN